MKYQVYVKSPLSKRFSCATKNGFDHINDAIRFIGTIAGAPSACISTRYEIRQGRKVVGKWVKFPDNDRETVVREDRHG